LIHNLRLNTKISVYAIRSLHQYSSGTNTFVNSMLIKSGEIALLFLWSLLLFPPAMAQTKPTVAVLDFEARGVSTFEAATLSDRLTTELGNTDAVILVERKQMDEILKEQGLQQSGCTTKECVAQVGQLLGVQYMVSGSINRIGKTYTLEAKMFSVETGENIKSVSKTHRGEIDDLIPVMEDVAWELVGLDKRELETAAILDFEARGISQLEAGTLTDRFASELGKTGAILLVARNEMNEILEEQGYRQTGSCTSEECAAEVGALLGVKNIIKGSIGKVGMTFTIDAQIVAVATGATVKTVSKTYRGEIDGLIKEMELLAWAIVDKQPPRELLVRRSGTQAAYKPPKQKSRSGAAFRSLFIPGTGQLYSGNKTWGLVWLGGEAVLGALAYLQYQNFIQARDDYNLNLSRYNSATDVNLIAEYKALAKESHATMVDAENQFFLFGGLAGGVWVLNVIHAYLTGPTETTAYQPKPSGIALAYSPNQIQLRWTFALD